MNIIWPKSPNRIITAKDLLSLHPEISLDDWEIKKQIINKWDQWQNKKDGSTEIIELFQVKLELALKSPLLQEDIKKVLLDTFGDKIPTIKSPSREETDKLWHIIHTDLHFDRIDHKNPKKYLKEIDDRTMRIFEELLKGKPSKLLYHNLWDYRNSDINNKTTKGTEQHNSIDENESFQMWLEHQIWLINTLASELPVDTVYTPWNHDKNKLQYLSDALDIYYSNSDVNVDNSHDPIKLYKYWNDLIGWTHWDNIKPNKIPEALAWIKLLNNNYIYRWHSHQQAVLRIGNMIIETLWSPASPSKWEKSMWFNSTDQIQGNLYDKKRGKVFTYYW